MILPLSGNLYGPRFFRVFFVLRDKYDDIISVKFIDSHYIN